MEKLNLDGVQFMKKFGENIFTCVAIVDAVQKKYSRGLTHLELRDQLILHTGLKPKDAINVIKEAIQLQKLYANGNFLEVKK